MLHSGKLYGTERMALATADGLRGDFDACFVAPEGEALSEAAERGFSAQPFYSARDMALRIRGIFARHRQVAVMATGVAHSLACIAWTALYRRKVAHLHIVHGGTDERLSYGRKRLLNNTPVRLVAVSEFVRERLVANGVKAAKVSVIENFLPTERVARMPRRASFQTGGVRRLLVISRIDPIKRVDLLLDALDLQPQLSKFEVRILGSGWDLESLRARAAARNSNVNFAGFSSDVERELTNSDLLVHTCPEEPFGLAILEAMAAGVPVLVPNSGGAGSLVVDGVSGFRFEANRADSLAQRILDIAQLGADALNRLVAAADKEMQTRFSAVRGISEYRRLLDEEFR
jgi:glycosyltransferase involved in cell wall biosynthesis